MNLMVPKSTLPFAAFLAVVRSGMGAAASSEATLKVNLPSMEAGLSPGAACSILTPDRPTCTGSPVEYVFSNFRPLPRFAVAVSEPSPLSTTVTLNEIGCVCGVMPWPARPSVFS